MFGPEGSLESEFEKELSKENPTESSQWMQSMSKDTGLVLRACASILRAKERLVAAGVTMSISAQFVEIYNESVIHSISYHIYVYLFCCKFNYLNYIKN